MNVSESKIVRIILIIAGSLFVGIGVIGIFVPLLPTTVFFILAAACFVRSSEKMYNWLLENKHFGHYIKSYMENRAMPKKAKVMSITMMWVTMGLSASFIPLNYVKLLLLVIAIGVTSYILSLKTIPDKLS